MFDPRTLRDTYISAIRVEATADADKQPAASISVINPASSSVLGDPSPESTPGLDLSAALEAIRHFARADTRCWSADDRLESVVTVEAIRSLLDVFQARLLSDLDADGTTDVRFGMRTASWVAASAGCARGPVAQRLRVGRALRNHFDQIDHAVADGTLRFDHAKALVDTANPRTTEALAAAQDEIIALAEGATFEQWKIDVTALAEVADADGPEPDPYADLSLKMSVTLDHTVHLDGTFDHASGLTLRQAVNTKANELYRRFTRDHQQTADVAVPTRAALRALALVELVHQGVSAEPGSGSVPRAEVTLVAHDHQVCDTDGIPLPQAAAHVWGCDPDIWAVVVNRMGIPVDVGHTNRLATIAQRHAITVRDGGCTFPGCDAPITWCDLHHVTPWQNGGPTDQANLIALCRHHHGVTHRTGWAMHLNDNQIPHWTTPTGHHLVGQRHHRQCDGARSDPDPPGPNPPNPDPPEQPARYSSP